jgi:hypothetical protein
MGMSARTGFDQSAVGESIIKHDIGVQQRQASTVVEVDEDCFE